MTARPLHQQYIIYKGSSGGGGENPDPATYCPANGYELPPDPAVFCPINGYTKPDEYVPPIEYPDPDPIDGDHILFLCNDEGAGGVNISLTTVPGGAGKSEIYDANMNLLSSANNTNVVFQTQGTGNIYIVKIMPGAAERRITGLSISYPAGYTKQALMVFQAKFYTPMLSSLSNAFSDIIQFRQCLFFCPLDELTTLSGTFKNRGIEGSMTLPVMPKLTSLASTFEGTTLLWKVVIEGATLPELTNMSSTCYNSKIREFYFPPNLPKLDIINRCCGGSDIEYTTIPTYAPLLRLINGWFQNCFKLKYSELIFPEYPSLESGGSVIYGTSVRKIHFTGDSLNFSNVSYMFDGAPELQEIKFPDNIKGGGVSTDWQSWVRSNHVLKKIILPLSMPDFAPSNYFIQYPSLIEEITTCNDWGTGTHDISVASPRIKSFYQPALRVTKLFVGKATPRSPLTDIEIDWANSDFTQLTSAVLLYGIMTTAEIERIYTALPVIGIAKNITIYSPGYAAADKTIAQAKGWNTPGGA